MFFALNSFENVESKTFIVRLSVERDGAQLCSTSVVSAASASRSTAPGKPPEAKRRCTGRRTSAASRLRSFCSPKGPRWTPRTTKARGLKAGSRGQKSSLRLGAPQKVFPGLKFEKNRVHVQECLAKWLSTIKTPGSMITM